MTIGESAFSGCAKLTSVRIPSAVREIADNAFNNCAKLSQVFLPGNLRSIHASAFKGCSALTSVLIPESVVSIANTAFNNGIRIKAYQDSRLNGRKKTDIPSIRLRMLILSMMNLRLLMMF